MNIAKNENLDLSTAYNNLIDSVPIDFITTAILIIAIVSFFILIYVKFSYSKNISKERKKELLNERKIRTFLSFCIIFVIIGLGIFLNKSIIWLADNLPDGSGGFIVALVGVLMLWKWKSLFKTLD